jgi:hypothetical protein
MRLVEADRDGIALVDLRSFTTNAHLAVSAENVVDLLDSAMTVQALGGAGRNEEMIDVGPVGEKHIGV